MHIIGDFFGCKNNFTEVEPAKELALSVVSKAGLTPVRVVGEVIGPGVTVVVILKQSHILLDTWPEEGYVAAELHTCGNAAEGTKAFSKLIEHLQPEAVRPHVLWRGPGAYGRG